MTLPIVHESYPYVGLFCFDELHGYSPEHQAGLARSGRVYLTEFRAVTQSGRESRFGGSVIAASWAQAEEEARIRGLGEKVIGLLMEVGEV